MATEAENAARQRNIKRLYEIAKMMLGKRSNQTNKVENKEGRTMSNLAPYKAEIARALKQLKNWKAAGPYDTPL